MVSMKKRSLLGITVAASLALLTALSLSLYSVCWHPNILVGKSSKQLYIPHNISFRELRDTLQKGDYLSSKTSFSFLARLMRYDRRIIPGSYQLTPNMSNWQALRLLRTGTQQPVKIVLHHVRDKADLAIKITQNLEISASAFEHLLHDLAFVSQYGFCPENVLTMFIPNTYELYWTISPEALFDRMYKEYQRFWNQYRASQAKCLNLTPVEVSILASIVQDETVRNEEASTIAGIFINRLNKKMPLQSDATIRYVLGKASVRRILYKDVTIDSAYNTYQRRGLPPGPLNVPERAMLDAVLNFTPHNYLYFSAKEDFSGYHYFTKSFEEHLHHARRYRKALNQAHVYR